MWEGQEPSWETRYNGTSEPRTSGGQRRRAGVAGREKEELVFLADKNM